MVVFIISREFIITGLRLLAASHQRIIPSDPASKFKTTSQIVGIIVILTILIINSFLSEFNIKTFLVYDKLLKNLNYNLNIIPYNPIDEIDFNSPSEERLNSFLKYLDKYNVPYVMRKSKGKKILAGCGQLGLYSIKKQ